MSRQVSTSYYVKLDVFDDLVINGSSIRSMLEAIRWANASSIEKNVYLYLVWVFYSNMEILTSRQDNIITNVGRVPIEFNVVDLNIILSTPYKGLEIYLWEGASL